MAGEGEWTEVAGEPGRAGEFLRADHPEIAAALERGDGLIVRGARVLRFREAPANLATKYAADWKPLQTGASLYEVVLDRTPFYAESGGQIGDTGYIGWGEGARAQRLRVVDTVGTPLGNAHRISVQGRAEIAAMIEQPLWAQVDLERRREIMRNHTATHLLHAALRKRLGTHVTQAGSLVAPDRLRFDFQHFAKVTKEELAEIERMVSDAVSADMAVTTDISTPDQAKARGAMALFGEKYGDRVRMVSIGATSEPSAVASAEARLGDLGVVAPDRHDAYISRELCGGTHLSRTGEIEQFLVTGESSVAAGIRRIEAVTGADVVRRLREERARGDEEAARKAALAASEKEKERERERARSASAGSSVGNLLAGATAVGDARVIAARVDAAGLDELKAVGDAIRAKGAGLVAVLAGVWDGNVGFVAVASDDLAARGVHAGKLVGAVAAATGGKGGGKPTFAQAGGKDPAKVDEALRGVEDWVRSALGG
jgi:alanyl-tRNA synthetase